MREEPCARGRFPSEKCVRAGLTLYCPTVSFPFLIAGWSSLVARRAHNPEVAGSNPAPATAHSRLEPGLDPVQAGFFIWERCMAFRQLAQRYFSSALSTTAFSWTGSAGGV